MLAAGRHRRPPGRHGAAAVAAGQQRAAGRRRRRHRVCPPSLPLALVHTHAGAPLRRAVGLVRHPPSGAGPQRCRWAALGCALQHQPSSRLRWPGLGCSRACRRCCPGAAPGVASPALALASPACALRAPTHDADTASASRDHIVTVDPDGLITVTGAQPSLITCCRAWPAGVPSRACSLASLLAGARPQQPAARPSVWLRCPALAPAWRQAPSNPTRRRRQVDHVPADGPGRCGPSGGGGRAQGGRLHHRRAQAHRLW